jgi:circadian clock protein KaiC
VHDQISTRRIRVVKYRGSTHGTNEYPFLIDRDGITVLPVTSLLLEHEAPNERISTGLAALDEMVGGNGLLPARARYCCRAAQARARPHSRRIFVDAACARGEKCLYFLFEESPQQMMRNMRAAGIDIRRWYEKGLLKFHADRPNRHGLETHLLEMHHCGGDDRPGTWWSSIRSTNLMTIGTQPDVRAMLTRVIDYLKTRGITAVFTSLTTSAETLETTEAMISSLMDTWVLVAVMKSSANAIAGYTCSSRAGMPHSNDVRAFEIGDRGIQIPPLPKTAAGQAARESPRRR